MVVFGSVGAFVVFTDVSTTMNALSIVSLSAGGLIFGMSSCVSLTLPFFAYALKNNENSLIKNDDIIAQLLYNDNLTSLIDLLNLKNSNCLFERGFLNKEESDDLNNKIEKINTYEKKIVNLKKKNKKLLSTQ